ncbi:MAG: phasin family protein [Panacagrimonas sp.]
MAARDTLDQLKSNIERLGRDSLDVVSNASRIVFEGVQKLAEQELQALNDYYKSATAKLKDAGGSGPSGYQDMAAQQLDLLQDTVQKVISHARESLTIISQTRAELTRLIGSSDSVLSAKALTRITAPAQKAIEDVKKAAAKAQKNAAKTAQDMKKSLEKELAYAEKKGKAAVKQGESKARAVSKTVKTKIESVLDISAPPAAVKRAVKAKPSPESRANRATSKAKKQPATRKSTK